MYDEAVAARVTASESGASSLASIVFNRREFFPGLEPAANRAAMRAMAKTTHTNRPEMPIRALSRENGGSTAKAATKKRSPDNGSPIMATPQIVAIAPASHPVIRPTAFFTVSSMSSPSRQLLRTFYPMQEKKNTRKFKHRLERIFDPSKLRFATHFLFDA